MASQADGRKSKPPKKAKNISRSLKRKRDVDDHETLQKAIEALVRNYSSPASARLTTPGSKSRSEGLLRCGRFSFTERRTADGPFCPIRGGGRAPGIGRFGRLHTQVSPCGRTPRPMGLRPSSSTAVRFIPHEWSPGWIGLPHEKRNCHQFHGERTSYRHS